MSIKEINAKLKVNNIFEYLPAKGDVLDFGCGDLSFAKEIKKRNTKLKIIGVDVVSFGNKPKNIQFVQYNGEKLPFKDNAFTCVIAYHVLHHCPNPEKALRECIRVSRDQILLIEPVYRLPFEVPFMKFTDWLYNFWKSESIAMPYVFFSLDRWKKVFKNFLVKLNKVKSLDNFPKYIPIGQTYLFSLSKKL